MISSRLWFTQMRTSTATGQLQHVLCDATCITHVAVREFMIDCVAMGASSSMLNMECSLEQT